MTIKENNLIMLLTGYAIGKEGRLEIDSSESYSIVEIAEGYEMTSQEWENIKGGISPLSINDHNKLNKYFNEE